MNIGDTDEDKFLEHHGTAILIMATYGNGGSPADGEAFVEWLKNLSGPALL